MKVLPGLLLLISFFTGMILPAQELLCEVRVNAPKLQTTDPKVLQDLENAIQDFFNNQAFTQDQYNPEEKIQLNLQLTITEEQGNNTFKADLVLQSTRPVYGSTYSSPLFTFVDKDILFTYEPAEPLTYSIQAFTSDLSAILTFYAYIVLGMDYDSFAAFGGTPHFQIAQNIVNFIPAANAGKNPGWRSLGNRYNRYWLIENLLSPRTRLFRQGIYEYHRQSLDVMYEDAVAGRANMVSALENMEQVNQLYPNSMIIQLFSSAKSNEIVEVFKQGDAGERLKVYQIMTKIDAANANNYRVIR